MIKCFSNINQRKQLIKTLIKIFKFIFEEYDDKVEIDFEKYIKNEDVIEYIMEGLSSSGFQTSIKLFFTDIKNDISMMNSIQVDNESDDAIELLSHLVFKKFSKDGFQNFTTEDILSFLQLLENPTTYA